MIGGEVDKNIKLGFLWSHFSMRPRPIWVEKSARQPCMSSDYRRQD